MSRITDIAKEMKTWWDEDDDPYVHRALDEIIHIDQEQTPSIDIVFCKECKHCNEWDHPNGIELYCNNPNVDPFDWGGSVSFYVKADDFCSYGEREGE